MVGIWAKGSPNADCNANGSRILADQSRRADRNPTFAIGDSFARSSAKARRPSRIDPADHLASALTHSNSRGIVGVGNPEAVRADFLVEPWRGSEPMAIAGAGEISSRSSLRQSTGQPVRRPRLLDCDRDRRLASLKSSSGFAIGAFRRRWPMLAGTAHAHPSETNPRFLAMGFTVLGYRAPLQTLIAADVKDGFISGVASTPSTDAFGHLVCAGAFDRSIKAKGLGGP